MSRTTVGSMAALILGAALASAPVFATDASMDDIYRAAQSGHLDQAQQMIGQVLKDHPESYKAHYVQAELYAREGKAALAREELARAEQINPSLSGFSERSVRELKQELGLLPRSAERGVGAFGGTYRTAPAPHFPWATVVVLGIVVLVFWALFRRRRTYVSYPGTMGAPGAGPGGPGYGPTGYGPGYGPGGYVGPGGGGIGSNIAGGLAGGLAAGAGIVAGEELAHHFLDGGQ